MPYKDKERQKQAQHESYLRNKDKVYARYNSHRTEIKEKIRNLKEGSVCEDCKLSWPHFVLHFHHRNPEEKFEGIARMISSCRSFEKILEEIKKCDLLCANCHAIREYSPH